jgi:hypothetical protein
LNIFFYLQIKLLLKHTAQEVLWSYIVQQTRVTNSSNNTPTLSTKKTILPKGDFHAQQKQQNQTKTITTIVVESDPPHHQPIPQQYSGFSTIPRANHTVEKPFRIFLFRLTATNQQPVRHWNIRRKNGHYTQPFTNCIPNFSSKITM